MELKVKGEDWLGWIWKLWTVEVYREKGFSNEKKGDTFDMMKAVDG